MIDSTTAQLLLAAFLWASLAVYGFSAVWWLIETALRAPSVAAVVPAQDLLALGNGARMNLPGTTEGNWGWRLDAGALTPSVAARLREAASTAGGRGIPRS